MNTTRILSVLALAGLLMTGCASVVHVEKDETANLGSYKTFAWVDTKEDRSDSAKTQISDLTERKIREAVTTELEKAGWRASKKPDVLIAYDVLVERSVREMSNPVYSQPFSRYYFNPYTRRWMTMYYPSQFMGYDRERQPVNEGTVTISVIDARTDKTVWQGWTTDQLNSRNISSKEIRNSVKNIFRKFDLASR